MTDTTVTIRPLFEIARDIQRDPAYKAHAWKAGPYVTAMTALHGVNDRYYEDDGRSIVAYALSNLTGWRGDTARTVKSELKAILKGAGR